MDFKGKSLETLYEETYVALEIAWADKACPECKQAPRTHNVNVIPLKGGDVETQPVCRYGPDGKLKKVFRRAAGADKTALRETFGNIYLEERGQRLEDFLGECEKRVEEANRRSQEACDFIAKVENGQQAFAEDLGVPTSSRGEPYGLDRIFTMVKATIAHLKQRSAADQESALEFFNTNQALAREVKALKARNAMLEKQVAAQEAELVELRDPHRKTSSLGGTNVMSPQLRVVGTPPPIPKTATTGGNKQ
jgi:chromosome segregation ATPase